MSYSHTKDITGVEGLFDFDGISEINMIKTIKIDVPIAASTDEQTLHAALPTNALVVRAWLNVATAEDTGGTKTLTIGTATATSGDPDGLIKSVNVGSTGIKVGDGALIGTVLSGNAVVVVDFGSNDWVEFEGTLYIQYIEC
jgi:hypothetical protein